MNKQNKQLVKTIKQETIKNGGFIVHSIDKKVTFIVMPIVKGKARFCYVYPAYCNRTDKTSKKKGIISANINYCYDMGMVMPFQSKHWFENMADAFEDAMI